MHNPLIISKLYPVNTRNPFRGTQETNWDPWRDTKEDYLSHFDKYLRDYLGPFE
jgi:hypothetical protein